jgi:DNA-binding MarR family transcriptional regulator
MAKQKLSKEIVPRSVHPIFKDHFCYSLTKAGVLFRSVLEETLLEFGIVPPQSGILLILATQGEYNQNILGQEMNIDKASMVKFIDGLEKLGYIKRTVDPNDRRAKFLTLTVDGKKIQKRFLKIHQDLERQIFKDFSRNEQDTLRELMPKVLASVLNYIHRDE